MNRTLATTPGLKTAESLSQAIPRVGYTSKRVAFGPWIKAAESLQRNAATGTKR
jgi:hypothetical protein